MNKTTYEKGIEKGIETGVERGREFERREIVRDLLIEKFGSLTPETELRLAKMNFLELIYLTKAIRKANSLEELNL